MVDDRLSHGDGDVPEENAIGGTSEDESAAGTGKKKKKKQSFWRELPILIVIALALTVLIQAFLARVYFIPSASMEHTLHGCDGCTGDRILVDKITYDFTDPGPGDVIVFERPDTWATADFRAAPSSNVLVQGLQKVGALFGLAEPDEEDYVKRVVATAGQTVQCCDSQNRVLVDGKPLDEPYISWEDGRPRRQESFEPVRVPEGKLWVMGDNRNNSCDSRCQGDGREGGAVPVDKVIGKARVIVLPPSRWGGVTDHNPQQAVAGGSAAPATGVPAVPDGLPLGATSVALAPVLWRTRRITRGVLESASPRS